MIRIYVVFEFIIKTCDNLLQDLPTLILIRQFFLSIRRWINQLERINIMHHLSYINFGIRKIKTKIQKIIHLNVFTGERD